MAVGASGAAAAAAALAEAVKAMGAIVNVEKAEFETIVSHAKEPLVLVSPPGGFFHRRYRYATSYKGFVFYTDTDEPLMLSGSAELIATKNIWVPGG